MPLTPRQSAFVREYLKDPNATRAAKAAGYSEKTAYAQGSALLKKQEVSAAVAKGQTHLEGKAIATRAERQQFWSRVMSGAESDARWADRLKASELLGKSEADFTDKLEHSGTMSIRVVNPYSRSEG